MKLKQKISGHLDLLLLLAIVIIVNLLGRVYYYRFDLTEEKKYSLSATTKSFLKNLDETVTIKVFLTGKLPSGFKELENSTKDILNEFKAYAGRNIEYEFIDINKFDKETQEKIGRDLINYGLNPLNLREISSGEETQKVIFPGAIITHKGSSVAITLLENQVGYGQFEILNNSIILLEYKFANTIQKLKQPRQPTVAFAQGHGEPGMDKLSDIIKSLQQDNFAVAMIDLNEGHKIEKIVDVLVIAKPTIPYAEKVKFKIDQYIMRGGKVFWLLDVMGVDMDSLQGTDFFMAHERPLSIETDMLYKYGVRLNYNLVQDLQNTPIPIVTGEVGGIPQTQLFPWVYNPLLFTTNEHAVVKNIDPVAGKFVSTIDTIKSAPAQKTILLTTSAYSKALMAPVRVHLGILNEQPNPSAFKQPFLPVAVALEGKFNSVFKNRVMSGAYTEMMDTVPELAFRDTSVHTKMIVVGDGDIIINEVAKNGQPFPLGFDRNSGKNFGNKVFVKNCIEYLLDDNNLIETRNKEIKLRQLDGIKVTAEKKKWQIINVAVPAIILIIFGIVFGLIRKRRFAR
jgi:ABC-2 type transport system permease protein